MSQFKKIKLHTLSSFICVHVFFAFYTMGKRLIQIVQRNVSVFLTLYTLFSLTKLHLKINSIKHFIDLPESYDLRFWCYTRRSIGSTNQSHQILHAETRQNFFLLGMLQVLSKLEKKRRKIYSYDICFPKWMFTEIMLQFIFYVCMRMGEDLFQRGFFFFLDIKMGFYAAFFSLLWE